MTLVRLTRRQLLAAGIAGGAALGIGGGLYVAFRLGRRHEARRRIAPPREQRFVAGSFVAIDERGKVTLWLARPEVGQGIVTTLPMVIADELGADPVQITVMQAPASELYGNQMTGVSASVRQSFEEMRNAGAAAREMLIGAAADALDAPPGEFRTEKGAVIHLPTGRALSFASLVGAAAKRPVPQKPVLKPHSQWKYIGQAMPRLDLPAKIDGSARYGLDIRVPGMLFAVVARPPAIGAKLIRFDASDAVTVPGVQRVIQTEAGVAVVATHTHAAMLGRRALRVEWNAGPNVAWNTASIAAHLDAVVQRDGVLVRRDGAGAKSLHGPGKRVRAVYRLPYLAHATMEPMNCTASVRDDHCTLWAPHQSPSNVRDAAARRLGFSPERVAVHVPLVGGAFGRRIENDFVLEALDLSKALGRPVQVVWSREDDMRHDWYRPCSLHYMEARLADDGMPVALLHRIAAPSILQKDPNFKAAVDPTAVEGAKENPYRITNLQIEYVRAELPMRVGFWRSVGHSYNAFAVESFLDEIAATSGRDPVELRRLLLPAESRHRKVLDVAIAAAGKPRSGDGRGRGVAIHASFGSYVAMVADIRIANTNEVAVESVVCAADCGFAVNPDGARAQLEGGIAFGLTAAMHGSVEFDRGAATTGNFDDYPLLRFDEMPAIRVVLVNGGGATLGGVGEIGVPPIAPAVCNALYNASRARVRSLPLRSHFGRIT